MDSSDDEEMRDASSSSMGEGGFQEEEAAAEGVMTLEVTWFQVDLDYEYDAPRWFDLAREEAPLEAAAAQQWFASAPNYPPSPLILKMLQDDLGLQSLRSTADADAMNCTTTSHECSTAAEHRFNRVEERGQCNGASRNGPKPGVRNAVRCTSSRSSTLMKPTASQIARQNRQVEAKNLTLSKKLMGARSERTTMSLNDFTYQPAKRQRLESGHINKVAQVAATHQPMFIHKNHEKNAMNRNINRPTTATTTKSLIDRPTGLPKLKITVPREPELATKLRAERSRILRAMPTTNTKQINQRHAPSVTTTQVTAARKMGPIKNVVNPFRAPDHQHTGRQHDDVGSNVPACTSNGARHLKHVDKTSEDCRGDLFKFKARPVDRKILESKGDVGVFRGAKRNTTVPKEFNLSTGRKGNPGPLSELFNKLSLTAGAHRGIDRQTAGLPNYITTKDCKENMIGNMQR
ncbi:hypothetical protein QOZ80_6BG0459310 [Eleusine coracana subsp. coracana]|nr:hypothetical protein QOZ80_6BG0459310 [Eleusine coracana subsp. coracana]